MQRPAPAPSPASCHHRSPLHPGPEHRPPRSCSHASCGSSAARESSGRPHKVRVRTYDRCRTSRKGARTHSKYDGCRTSRGKSSMKAWTTLFPLYRKSGREGGERNTEKPECDLKAHPHVTCPPRKSFACSGQSGAATSKRAMARFRPWPPWPTAASPVPRATAPWLGKFRAAARPREALRGPRPALPAGDGRAAASVLRRRLPGQHGGAPRGALAPAAGRGRTGAGVLAGGVAGGPGAGGIWRCPGGGGRGVAF